MCGKECSRFVTAEMRVNALANVEKYAWAAKAQKAAIAAAAPWVKLSDDELWDLVPSQELPRDPHTNPIVGCPDCGKGIVPYGGYPWKSDFWEKPWKLTCPNCGEVYPKNDFHAFYKTALDEHGMFRRKLGDRSLLFNAEHPDPKDPLHNVCVDDGYGMMDENGRIHTMIAYYNHWAQWDRIIKGLGALTRAYTHTGERRYAHKAAVLLDRIADVYPQMDYLLVDKLGFKPEDRSYRQRGRIRYRTWENGVGTSMAYAYDKIHDGIQGDEELVNSCSRRAAQHKLGDKSSIPGICRHIEDHLLLEILKSVRDGRIWGNTGMHQQTLAVAAIALDRPKETEEWLDYLFDPRFPEHVEQRYKGRPETIASVRDSIPRVFVEKLTRDGIGAECGSYGLGWTRQLRGLPDILAKYSQYTKHDLLKEFPSLKQCFLIEGRVSCLDAAFPSIGDSSRTGGWYRPGNVSTFVKGYKLYGDPRMAGLAWHYANGDINKLRGTIFEKDPMAVGARIAEAAKAHPFRLKCEHLGRYGQAVLQTETKTNGRALWIHYGYGLGHSHHDSLNLGLYAKNVDMLPDLGYPEYTGPWPKRHAWTAHTISHNTLMVNETRGGSGGKIDLFAVRPPLRVIDVSSKTAYGGKLDTYRRTAALIDVSDHDSYVFDVFRARGGKNHRLSYHGPGAAAAVEGIELTKQAKGTFAGEDVEFAQFYDGKPGWGYSGSGFMYLYDVERSREPVANYFTVDWKAGAGHTRGSIKGRIRGSHEPHLRLHALTSCDEVALATGNPPEKKHNPERLRYLIHSRLGENMQSQFVTVLEPYDKTPFIRRVRRLKVEHKADPNSVAAVAVELQDGTTDIVISCEEPTRVGVEGGIEFEGRFGMVRLVGDEVKCMRMSNARLLKVKDLVLTANVAAYKGKVTKVDATDPENNLVFLEPPLPQDAALVGQTIHFNNDVAYDTSYDIKAVGDGWISTGDITIIQGFKDPMNFNAGYKYLVNPGDEYVVPNCVGLDQGERKDE